MSRRHTKHWLHKHKIPKAMSRNNEKNIKKHNDKLHKSQAKAKQAEVSRKEKLKQIAKQFNAKPKDESGT